MSSPAHTAHVFFVDDEVEIRDAAVQTLELEGIKVTAFADARSALAGISRSWPGVVVTDVRMPGVDGLEFLDRIMEIDTDIPVVVISAHGDIRMAIAAIRNGAYDFVEKADDPERIVETVRRAQEMRGLVMENRRLKQALDVSGDLERRLIGKTPVMEALRQRVSDLANTDVDVLIVGETGTGKEVVARCLHEFGARGRKRFVALNCGALPESVIESELFGHEAGAFTGAVRRRIGRIEYADGGTLFLDEIESMPAHLQTRLLRVLQERNIERLGGNRPIAVDLRVIAAAKVDLRKAADAGKFREDLYYRLHVASFTLAPLSGRVSDIPLLFRHFADMASARYHRPVPDITPAMAARLMAASWPGNVRELRNAAERFVLGMTEEKLPAPPASGDGTLAGEMAAFERAAIAAALSENNGRIGETAKSLGLPRKTLYLRMQKYNLDRADHCP
ncbi:Transcriptional response regulatory protein GlrR [hydrothermal vent metagenome]|uniref:Transcriptional response regulatory protein GlrR n=1 Tax=hydrothermal vent metagenome TaxID=652676 RepID=A0A3B0TWD3_9ZZZZ